MDYYNNNVTYYISLDGHVELERYRYVYFILTLAVYLLIICCNSVVISVICANKSLHEPMYIFIAALLCNSLCGTTAFYPKLLIDLLSETQMILFEGCIFQAFWLYVYATAEFTLLSAMAYDRYVSICKPLQYVTLVKMSTVRKLLFICWFVPSCEIGVGGILTYQLNLCKFKLNRIYCNYSALLRLSCRDTTLVNSYGLFISVVAVFPPVIFIIFSYIRILTVCLKYSKEFRRKALQTCFPHLITFILFSVTSLFELLSVILSIENAIIPPLINPVIYGLKQQEIFNRIK
ncbi:olfactory receptor 6N2-like [Astyanax mexicanus]|uniref:Olfactory receptor n=1 Tax=Astyanax mexicanus TaxID=7994 RepID=A0A8T2M603_ASTMX|nr:olfactory receptor 6N2-like [Astyanax mexicanus]